MGTAIAASNSVSITFKHQKPLSIPAPIITLIAALAEPNRVIGRGDQLPWYLPDDLQRFKTLTWGHPIIMGRKTWEFCLEKRTLPHRHNIIISRTLSPTEDSQTAHPSSSHSSGDGSTSFQVVRSLPAAITLAQSLIESSQPNIFVIGGASIYTQTLHMAHRLELTLIHGEFEGDAFFPAYEALLPHFDCISTFHTAHPTPPHTYLTYERKPICP